MRLGSSRRWLRKWQIPKKVRLVGIDHEKVEVSAAAE
jgi:hypothetical protein